MIHAIFLAAGKSSRFGENKLLYPINGKPMYLWGLTALTEAAGQNGNTEITVVSCSSAILRNAEAMGLHAVYGTESGEGIAGSIRTGIRACSAKDGDYLLFLVADQPYLHAETVAALMKTAEKKPLCAALSKNGEPCNPALFSEKLLSELLSLSGDRGGKAILKKHADDGILVPCKDEKELSDIDTKEALQEIGKETAEQKA